MEPITYRDAIREALIEEMTLDDNMLLIGEDIGFYGGAYGVTKGLMDVFGDKRVRDTPISEAAIVGVAIGCSIAGVKTVAEIMYLDFTMLAMDQIVNQAAKIRYMSGGKMNVPLVIRTTGGVGRASAAQHSQSLESLFISIPGLKVVMPSNPSDAWGLLKSSIHDANPIIFIEHKGLYNMKGEINKVNGDYKIGSAAIGKPGKDITLISYSRMYNRAVQAEKELHNEGISAELIDLRSLKPLDKNTLIKSVKKTHAALIIEEDCLTGGVGAEIAATISEECFFDLKVPVMRLAGKNVPIPCSPVLEKVAIPSIEDIIDSTIKLLQKKGKAQ